MNPRFKCLNIFLSFLILSAVNHPQGIFDKMLNSPMRLKIENSIGSGVLYNDSANIYLITAKHVIFNESKTNVGGKTLQIEH